VSAGFVHVKWSLHSQVADVRNSLQIQTEEAESCQRLNLQLGGWAGRENLVCYEVLQMALGLNGFFRTTNVTENGHEIWDVGIFVGQVRRSQQQDN
jgi:hypothetical protein